MIPTRIVIIGGGISGLAVAHRLVELGRQTHTPLAVTVLEARERLGGVIRTDARDGALLEAGPDAFITEKPHAVDLCRRLGLADELIGTQPACRRSFIVKDGRLIAVPEGWYLIAPGRVMTLWSTPLLSWRGKARMACEPFMPVRRYDDESVASFVRRRFGREALERIGQPMIGGIYTADPEQLSLRAAMPKLADMEQRYGSVMGALRAHHGDRNGATTQARPGSDQHVARASGPRYSLFVTLRGGMRRLIEALAQSMPEVTLRTRAVAARLIKGESWTVALADGARLDADLLCMALPAPSAASLVEPIDGALAEELRRIPYESVATVNMTFREADVPRPLNGFGFVVPAIERRPIIGCTFSSVKFAGRAQDGVVLVRAFVGGALNRQSFVLDDTAMRQAVLAQLKALLGIRAEPLMTSIARFPQAMPQYHVGHLARIDAIEHRVVQHSGLSLTGNAYRGIGIPDCIHQAGVTAERIMARVLAMRGSVYAGT